MAVIPIFFEEYSVNGNFGLRKNEIGWRAFLAVRSCVVICRNVVPFFWHTRLIRIALDSCNSGGKRIEYEL